jgi:hypothetical protein
VQVYGSYTDTMDVTWLRSFGIFLVSQPASPVRISAGLSMMMGIRVLGLEGRKQRGPFINSVVNLLGRRHGSSHDRKFHHSLVGLILMRMWARSTNYLLFRVLGGFCRVQLQP